MPDDLDRAKDLEIMQRDIALDKAKQRATQPEQQHDDDGNVICIDCAVLIPQARLEAKPDAARCIDCKAAHEEKQKRRI